VRSRSVARRCPVRAHSWRLLYLRLVRRPPPRSTLFPYTTLFRSLPATGVPVSGSSTLNIQAVPGGDVASPSQQGILLMYRDARTDRKSTRLNSSHVSTSYAVFCLKKNKLKQRARRGAPRRRLEAG